MIILPEWPQNEEECVWHIFPIRCPERETLQKYLTEHGVQTLIHYPIAPHKQVALTDLSHRPLPITQRIHDEELSLPVSPVMKMEDADYVIELINKFVV